MVSLVPPLQKTQNMNYESKFHEVWNMDTFCSGETKWRSLDEISGASSHAAYVNIADHYG
jgi:hypothetical protein